MRLGQCHVPSLFLILQLGHSSHSHFISITTTTTRLLPRLRLLSQPHFTIIHDTSRRSPHSPTPLSSCIYRSPVDRILPPPLYTTCIIGLSTTHPRPLSSPPPPPPNHDEPSNTKGQTTSHHTSTRIPSHLVSSQLSSFNFASPGRIVIVSACHQSDAHHARHPPICLIRSIFTTCLLAAASKPDTGSTTSVHHLNIITTAHDGHQQCFPVRCSRQSVVAT